MAGAIQNLLAARLGRGFIPLAGLFVAGVVRIAASGSGGWIIAVGALASGSVLLVYGLAVVQDVLARPQRLWKSLAPVAIVLPGAYGLYVLAWRGLRGLTVAVGALELGTAVVYAILGGWVLRAWLRVVEIRRLARVMAEDIDEP